jgi:hypothetical protein
MPWFCDWVDSAGGIEEKTQQLRRTRSQGSATFLGDVFLGRPRDELPVFCKLSRFVGLWGVESGVY